MRTTILLIISLISINITAQIDNVVDYTVPKSYELGGVTITGANNLNDNTLITISELSVGEDIKIPGDKITNAITKLWGQGLFSDIDIKIEKIVENIIFLNINV